MNVGPTLDQDKMAERLARSKQTAGAFCESSLLRLETYGNRRLKSTHGRLIYGSAAPPATFVSRKDTSLDRDY